jgi:hypothetical protein
VAQFGRPNGTITTGSWSANGGPSTLWECIDETSFSDTDFIRTTGTASACEVSLTSITDPVSNTGHTIRIRMRAAGSGGAENLTVALVEGTTVIATSGNLTNRSATFAERTFTLSGAQADSITNYSNLRLRFSGSHAAGETIDVSWAEFEVPDAPLVFNISGDANGLLGTTTGTATFVAANNDRELTGAVNGLIGTTSGTATHTPPLFELTGSVNGLLGTASGTIENSGLTFTLSGAVNGLLGAAESTAEFVKPVFSLSGDITGLMATAMGTATFAPPTFTLSGSTNGLLGTVSATAETTKPAYELSGEVNGLMATATGEAVFGAPINEVTGAVNGLIGSSTGEVTTTKPVFNISGSSNGLLGSAEGTAVFGGVVYSLQGDVNAPIGITSGTAEYLAPGGPVELSGAVTGLMGISQGFIIFATGAGVTVNLPANVSTSLDATAKVNRSIISVQELQGLESDVKVSQSATFKVNVSQ